MDLTSKIIDGKAVAALVRKDVAAKAAEFEAWAGFPPGLSVVLVGDDPASQVYVRSKEKACQEVGFHSQVFRLPASTPQSELLALIDTLNKDPRVHGILVQFPLPEGFDQTAVINAIDPAKDVDGLHPLNAGRLASGLPGLVPCTPKGIMRLIQTTGVDLTGKMAVVIGRSNLVGKPIAAMLLAANATVTIAHSRTVDLPNVVRQADLVVAAVGRKELVRGDWLKPGAIVIDVGINRVEGKLYGDVAFAEALEVVSAITPVPGGVGPMTIAMLLENTLEAAFAIQEAKTNGHN